MPFHVLIISLFSISPLHVRWHLPYIIKYDNSKRLKNSLTNEQLILDQRKVKLLIHLFSPFGTYYLDFWAKNCCIVIYIAMANTTFVAHRRIYRAIPKTYLMEIFGENSEGLEAINYFRKNKLYHIYLRGF